MQDHDKVNGTAGLWQQLTSRRFTLYNREWCAEAAALSAEHLTSSRARARATSGSSVTGGGGGGGGGGGAAGGAGGGARYGAAVRAAAAELSPTSFARLVSKDGFNAMDVATLRARMEGDGGEGVGEDSGGGMGRVDEEEISAEVRALMDQYMRRGPGGPATTGSAAAPLSAYGRAAGGAGGGGSSVGARSLTGWEVDEPDGDAYDAGFGAPAPAAAAVRRR